MKKELGQKIYRPLSRIFEELSSVMLKVCFYPSLPHDMQGTEGGTRTNSLVTLCNGPLYEDSQVLDDQLEQLFTDTGFGLEDRLKAVDDGDRWRKLRKSVLAAWHGDDEWIPRSEIQTNSFRISTQLVMFISYDDSHFITNSWPIKYIFLKLRRNPRRNGYQIGHGTWIQIQHEVISHMVNSHGKSRNPCLSYIAKWK